MIQIPHVGNAGLTATRGCGRESTSAIWLQSSCNYQLAPLFGFLLDIASENGTPKAISRCCHFLLPSPCQCGSLEYQTSVNLSKFEHRQSAQHRSAALSLLSILTAAEPAHQNFISSVDQHHSGAENAKAVYFLS